MKSCEYYQRLMSLLLDEELSETQEAELREHLAVCPDCQRVFSAFDRMASALREDRAVPPPALAEGVMERIAAGNKSTSRIRANRWRRLTAAACLVLIIGGTAILSSRGFRGGAASGASIQVYESAAVYSEAQSADMAPADMAEPQAIAETEMEAAMEAAEDEIVMTSEAGAPDAPKDAGGGMGRSADLAVYGREGERVGVIHKDDEAALAALLTDADIPLPAGDWEPVYTVEYDGVTYTFAADSTGEHLAWWGSDEAVRLSPGSLAQLQELISPGEEN